MWVWRRAKATDHEQWDSAGWQRMLDIGHHSINLAKKTTCISEGPKSHVTRRWYHDAAPYLGVNSPSLEEVFLKGSADMDQLQWSQYWQGEVLWPCFFKSENNSNFYQGLISISDTINDTKPGREGEDFAFNAKTGSWLV